MVTQKKAYIRPEVTRRGDVEDVTQGLGSLGSGDILYRLKLMDEDNGCLIGKFCTGS